MDPTELERQIGEALRRLPPQSAPQTLVPRVMAAARALRALPWYRRSWFTWPLGARLMSAAAAIVVVIVGAPLVPAGFEWATAALSAAVPATADRIAAALPPGVHRWIEVGYGAQAVWRTVLGPFVLCAAAFTVAMGTVFAVGAAALTQLALGRASA
jgi:hypothetical protein